jgi:MFS family permease
MREKNVDEKKGIYWGWYIVTGAFLVLSVNYGARYCFGVFVKPLANEFDWSRSVISLGASLNMLVYSSCAIFIGRIVDRIAPRWIITAGALMSSLSFILMSFVRTPLEFYLVYGLMTGIGSAGLGIVVANPSVGKWFIKKRGLAIGITSMGVSFGTLVLTPAAGCLVRNYNWQTGFLFLGILTFGVGVILSQTLMKRANPEAYGLLPDGEVRPEKVLVVEDKETPHLPYRILFKDVRFRIMGVSFGLSVMTQMATFVHQVAYAQDRGIDAIAAASSLAAVGIAGFLGQFFFGWFSDKIKDAKYSAILGTGIMAVGMILLLKAATVKALYLYAFVYGFGYGSLAPMMSILAADRFGRHVLGSVYGMLTFFIGFGGSMGPLLGGLIYDRFGSYTIVWQFNIAVLLLVVLMMSALKKGVRQ